MLRRATADVADGQAVLAIARHQTLTAVPARRTSLAFRSLLACRALRTSGDPGRSDSRRRSESRI